MMKNRIMNNQNVPPQYVQPQYNQQYNAPMYNNPQQPVQPMLSQMESSKGCPNCGSRNEKGAKYCNSCGYAFTIKKTKNATAAVTKMLLQQIIVLSVTKSCRMSEM